LLHCQCPEVNITGLLDAFICVHKKKTVRGDADRQVRLDCHCPPGDLV
jgi:hypothetical protein